jgi:hypothetical protein
MQLGQKTHIFSLKIHFFFQNLLFGPKKKKKQQQNLSKKKPPNGMCLVLGDSTPTLVPALDERW